MRARPTAAESAPRAASGGKRVLGARTVSPVGGAAPATHASPTIVRTTPHAPKEVERIKYQEVAGYADSDYRRALEMIDSHNAESKKDAQPRLQLLLLLNKVAEKETGATNANVNALLFAHLESSASGRETQGKDYVTTMNDAVNRLRSKGYTGADMNRIVSALASDLSHSFLGKNVSIERVVIKMTSSTQVAKQLIASVATGALDQLKAMIRQSMATAKPNKRAFYGYLLGVNVAEMTEATAQALLSAALAQYARKDGKGSLPYYDIPANNGLVAGGVVSAGQRKQLFDGVFGKVTNPRAATAAEALAGIFAHHIAVDK